MATGAARTAAQAPASEQLVLEAIERGDYKCAVTLLDDAYGAALYRYIRHIVHSDDVADDVYQNTFVQVYRDLGEFSGRSSVRTWLYSVARHRCLDTLKAQKRHYRRFAAGGETPHAADRSPGAEERLGHAELVGALEECIQKLKPHVRTAVLLRYREGFSYDEIARICGAKPAALRARVSRALPVLRACIERRGLL